MQCIPFAPAGGPAERVAVYLLSTDSLKVTTADLVRECGLRTDNTTGVLRTRLVREAMRLRGWYRSTKKREGIPGEHGRALVRVP